MPSLAPTEDGIVGDVRLASGLFLLVPFVAAAQRTPARRTTGPCDFSAAPMAVWWGTETQLPVSRVAAYLAPIFWFSPDEPVLDRNEGADIRVPQALPMDSSPPVDAPVVYFQLDRVVTRPNASGPAYHRTEPGAGMLDLRNVHVFTLSYFTYYAAEVGLGAHAHDLEPAEMRVAVLPADHPVARTYAAGDCTGYYVIGVTRTTAKAHAFVWFWSVLDTDEYSEFPMHLLVEEGKHALATDKNGDGVFTPGYDVNHRVNDAWGIRDIIRTGMLFSGGYESWMAKVRRPEHRIFPPLPDDSPLRRRLARRAGRIPYVVYQLRPLPPKESAAGDAHLHHLMKMQGAIDNWPEQLSSQNAKQTLKFLQEGTALKSLSIAYRVDGDQGFSFVFPFFVVKHLEDPMTGGFILQRMYLKDEKLRDFGWTALYTRSASRWLDPYLSAGAEWNTEVDTAGVRTTDVGFVFETGLKFRVNLAMSPLKFMSVLTDYWGLRLGVKNTGFWDVNRITYVLEFGAGAF